MISSISAPPPKKKFHKDLIFVTLFQREREFQTGWRVIREINILAFILPHSIEGPLALVSFVCACVCVKRKQTSSLLYIRIHLILNKL